MPRKEDLRSTQGTATVAPAIFGSAVPLLMTRHIYYMEVTNDFNGPNRLDIYDANPAAGGTLLKTVQMSIQNQIIELPEGAHVESSIPFLKIRPAAAIVAAVWLQASAGNARVYMEYEDDY